MTQRLSPAREADPARGGGPAGGTDPSGEERSGGGERRPGRGTSSEILNVRRRMEARRGRGRRAVVWVGNVLARPAFFFVLLALHAGWVIANLPGWVPWTPWDPPPFTLLATIASVEAPFIALLVLMRQEHDRRIAELREETALQVDLHTEREASAQLRLLAAVAERLGIERLDEIAESDDEPALDLEEMQRTLDPEHLVEETRRQLEESGEDPP